MTNRLTGVLVFGLFLVGTVSESHAQTAVIIQKWVAVSRVLAGYFDVGLVKVPAENITVEVRSSYSGTLLATTKTDPRGYFHLETPKSEGIFYLRLSAPGMNPYELRVRIRKNGPKELHVHMSIAT
jgi:hypothetical protein